MTRKAKWIVGLLVSIQFAFTCWVALKAANLDVEMQIVRKEQWEKNLDFKVDLGVLARWVLPPSGCDPTKYTKGNLDYEVYSLARNTCISQAASK